ncbi:MAG TPA: prepilin-type N-terminal cleavage/methylation domain-containing protein [Candidatus Bathyarchaeia archaeon]|nr:prepilin-type N-terminal cleavage/methylation domain-containing protein [Candidatus Bathyarchaeia archaeon]
MMRRHDRQGFTLMEILLAVMLSGAVLSCIYGVFVQGLRVQRFFARRGEVSQDRYWITTILTRDLENMIPYTLPGTAAPFFTGSTATLGLVVADDQGLRQVRYRLLPPETTHVHTVIVNRETTDVRDVFKDRHQENRERPWTLVREVLRFPFRGGGEDVVSQQIVSNHVAPNGLHFYYQKNNEETVWQEEWTDTIWPLRVRLDVLLFDSEGKERRLVKDVLIVNNQSQEAGMYAVE